MTAAAAIHLHAFSTLMDLLIFRVVEFAPTFSRMCDVVLAGRNSSLMLDRDAEECGCNGALTRKSNTWRFCDFIRLLNPVTHSINTFVVIHAFLFALDREPRCVEAAKAAWFDNTSNHKRLLKLSGDVNSKRHSDPVFGFFPASTVGSSNNKRMVWKRSVVDTGLIHIVCVACIIAGSQIWESCLLVVNDFAIDAGPILWHRLKRCSHPLLTLKSCDQPILYHSANIRWLLPLLSLITPSFAFKQSSFLTSLFAVASISFWFVFATSRACYSYKCSLAFKQTTGCLVIHSVLLLPPMTEPLTVLCFSIKFVQPLSLGLRICLQSVN